MTPPPRCRIEVEVRYAETDQMGVVHHAVYPVWFELARTHLCAESGHHYSDIEGLGYFLMVTGLEVRFRSPARYGDTVAVDCWVEKLGSRGLRFAYEVFAEERRLATGATDHIWVERDSGRPSRAPALLQEAFQRYSAP
jgi:acyl-CoA thioester hydrolase